MPPQVLAGPEVALAVLFFAVAAVYASVGQAGASAFLAILALAAVPPEAMRPTAFLLNVVAASVALVNFRRAGLFYPRVVARFAVGSVPMSALGGALRLDPGAYRVLVGVVLCLAAAGMVLPRPAPTGERPAPEIGWVPAVAAGAGIGLLSGASGTGGGIFLAPLLIFTGAADARQTAGIAAGFIWLNSVAALIGGGLSAAPPLDGAIALWAGCTGLGAFVGSTVGRDRLSPGALKRLMAAILLVAGLRSLLA